MKKIVCLGLTFLFLIMSSDLNAQQKIQPPKSKYDIFLSNKGMMIVIDYYELNTLASSYLLLDADVIRVESLKEVKYFYRLSFKGEHLEKSAFIAYDDLLEVLKSLKKLKILSEQDKSKSLEYRERIFVTNDGFKIGYYLKWMEQKVFVDLDDYQSDDIVVFDSFEPVIKSFEEAKNRIDQLKK
jgi:hypothetical protein